jgi:hypothetical protein
MVIVHPPASQQCQQVGVGEQGRAEVDLGGSFGWEGPGPHRHDQLSPISYAAKVTTPVLILHGETTPTSRPARRGTSTGRSPSSASSTSW